MENIESPRDVALAADSPILHASHITYLERYAFEFHGNSWYITFAINLKAIRQIDAFLNFHRLPGRLPLGDLSNPLTLGIVNIVCSSRNDPRACTRLRCYPQLILKIPLHSINLGHGN